ncbi:MAG: hydroxymethylbilane synthase [Thermoleophilaceae bacterium]
MIRLGTRGSALALAQAQSIADRLPSARLVPIATSGDRALRGDPSGPTPRRDSDKSRFVKEIEEALLAGEVDLAVHSAKDVPGELPAGLSIVGVPERADPLDALCGAASLSSLAEGAVVGTSSVRRRSQLLARRPDLDVRQLRGNVDTRLRRLREDGFDAIVLALAGLQRLDRGDEGVALAELVPAPGQGCLALEARSDDAATSDSAAALTDRDALVALTAERALVAALGATCHTPIGAYASLHGRALHLTAFVGLPDGSHWIRDELVGDPTDPAALGREAAGRLEAAGAREVLAEAEALAG